MNMLPERDYNVRLVDLPPGVRGFVRRTDDYYTIILNSRLTLEQNQVSFEHDRGHLVGNDYDKKHADVIEKQSH